MNPYIGVTGFTEPQQIPAVCGSLFEGNDSDYQLMVGVLANQETLGGRVSPWYPNRHPAVTDIQKIFPNGSKFLNLIHYHTSNKKFSTELEQLVNLAGENLNGFQLNICWPDPNEIEKLRRAGFEHNIVLQVGGGAFEKIGNDPKRLARKIKAEYTGLADYVLLDRSGGKGVPLQASDLSKFLDALSYELLNHGIYFVIAGGLCAKNLESIRGLRNEHFPLSWDAEGKLMDKSTGKLDLEAVKDYLSHSRLFVTYQR